MLVCKEVTQSNAFEGMENCQLSEWLFSIGPLGLHALSRLHIPASNKIPYA